MNREDIKIPAAAFGLSEPREVQRLPGGHIHESFRIRTAEGEFVLQRTGGALAPYLSDIMENTRLLSEVYPEGLHFLRAGDGYLYRDSGGRLWRASRYIPGRSKDTVIGTEEAERTGRAYGGFLRAVNRLPVSAFRTVIPHFHDPGRYLAELKRVVREAREKDGREEQLQERLSGLLTRIDCDRQISGMPQRLVHNDVKPANVIFREDESGIVIDTDTVMPGFLFFDLGDGLRSVGVMLSENGERLPVPDAGKAAAFYRGFTEELGNAFPEITVLDPAAAWTCITAELAVRYLGDAVSGNGYFHMSREETFKKAEFYTEYAERAEHMDRLVFLDSKVR